MSFIKKCFLVLLSILYGAWLYQIITSTNGSSGLKLTYDFNTNIYTLTLTRIIFGYAPLYIFLLNTARSVQKKSLIKPYLVILPALAGPVELALVLYEIITCNKTGVGWCHESGAGMIVIMFPIMIFASIVMGVLTAILANLQISFSKRS
ncbi:MAG: hypothetical protein NUV52_04590 [Candidatus Roizmanbacteria bacterium]|nr:hypothetical protein [Candidatus Roizmanbacteria bacterium]